jgi:uracil-DNA glycosylase
MDKTSLLAAYFRQQKELALPDIVFGSGSAALKRLTASSTVTVVRPPQTRTIVQPGARGTPVRGSPSKVGVPVQPAKTSPLSRLSKVVPLTNKNVAAAQPQAAARPVPQPVSSPPPYAGTLSFEQKRTVFKELYTARCAKCQLSTLRKTFVFGSGNVDAPLMIIGEAPGADEDEQGLPFVGATGRLLTELLAGVGMDRKRDCFITNILKCRPPENRNPEDAEILACMPLLEKQVEVIAPRALLLLGRIAAHALLGLPESIAKLRAVPRTYKGITAFVTYHPAAILRNMDYRKPAEEDLQKAVRFLKENGYHGISR